MSLVGPRPLRSFEVDVARRLAAHAPRHAPGDDRPLAGHGPQRRPLGRAAAARLRVRAQLVARVGHRHPARGRSPPCSWAAGRCDGATADRTSCRSSNGPAEASRSTSPASARDSIARGWRVSVSCPARDQRRWAPREQRSRAAVEPRSPLELARHIRATDVALVHAHSTRAGPIGGAHLAGVPPATRVHPARLVVRDAASDARGEPPMRLPS